MPLLSSNLKYNPLFSVQQAVSEIDIFLVIVAIFGKFYAAIWVAFACYNQRMSMLTAEIEQEEESSLDPGDENPPWDVDDDDEGDGGSGRWLTVATFWEPIEAHIARLKLESEEIDCMMIDENLVANYWGCASALGGIKLQVRESDFSPANLLLHGNQHLTHPPRQPEHACPRCGSNDVFPHHFSRRIAFLIYLLLSPFIRHRLCCNSCRFEWNY